jgi:hypothetical protein
MVSDAAFGGPVQIHGSGVILCVGGGVSPGMP